MDSSIEAHRQIQLTFQDKSTDANLNVEVTRESWLNEVKSQIESATQSSLEGAVPSLDGAKAGSESSEPEIELSGDLVQQVKLRDSEIVEPSENETELTAEAPLHGELSELEFSDEPEEMDFRNEPLPEPLSEASEKVTAALGSLTLPAALCDEELLQELAGIPEKMGFKIGEVAEMLGIKQYVLRYWETEFDVLKPKKAANNQRYYTKKDVENVYLIRKLLHRDRFSIEGARAALKDLKTVVKKEKDWSSVNHKVEAMHERVDHLVMDLRKLRQLFADA